MPEHPSDDYLLVNSGIKISRVNCELGRVLKKEFREQKRKREKEKEIRERRRRRRSV